MDRLWLGLSTTATGMLVVFVGLLILIVCITVMTLITARPKKEAPKLQPETTPIVPVREMQIDETDAENDMQVIAAITAAVAMIWQAENRESGFVVRRVRRVQNSTARARAARDEQMFSHF